MNDKALIATEPQSSRTTRYHPVFIGELLAKCNTSQLETAFSKFVEILKTYQDENSLIDRGTLMSSYGMMLNNSTVGCSSPAEADKALTASLDSTSQSFEYEFFKRFKWGELSRLGILSISAPLSMGDHIIIDNIRFEVIEIEHIAHRKGDNGGQQIPQVFLRIAQ